MTRPLIERSKALQYAAWFRAARKWAFWNALLVASCKVIDRLGGARVSGASQHARVEMELKSNNGSTAGLVTSSPQQTRGRRPAA